MQQANDFDPAKLAAVSDYHEQALNALYDRIGTDEAFARSFATAAENSKQMDKAVSGVVQEMLQRDPEIQKVLKKRVQEIDRKWWNGALKVLLGAIGGALVTIVTQYILFKIGVSGK